MPTKIIQKVAIESIKRKLEVSPGKAKFESVVKNKALRPNAERGKAVAVPRWCGQFNAAVLRAAEEAEQLPTPVKKFKKHMRSTLMEPGPLSKAFRSG